VIITSTPGPEKESEDWGSAVAQRKKSDEKINEEMSQMWKHIFQKTANRVVQMWLVGIYFRRPGATNVGKSIEAENVEDMNRVTR
jgi:hypothetical protein